MTRLLPLTLCAMLAVTPAMAESTEDTSPSPVERWFEFLLDEFAQDLGPALEGFQDLGPELRDFMTEMGPKLGELMGQIKDWSHYHAPEILPNGDIIIRRKSAEELPPEDGQIDI